MANSKRNIASFMEGFKPYMDMMLQLQIKKNEQRDRLTEELQKEQRKQVSEGNVTLAPQRTQQMSDTREFVQPDKLSLLPGYGFETKPPVGTPSILQRSGFTPPPSRIPMPISTMPARLPSSFETSQQETGNAFALDDKQYNFAGEKYVQKPGETMTTEYGPDGRSKGFKVSSGDKPLTGYQSATLKQKQVQFEAALAQRIKEGISNEKGREARTYIEILSSPYSTESEVKLAETKLNELLGDNKILNETPREEAIRKAMAIGYTKEEATKRYDKWERGIE